MGLVKDGRVDDSIVVQGTDSNEDIKMQVQFPIRQQ